MKKRNAIFWVFLPLVILLPACLNFSQLVRHSDPLTPEQHLQLGFSYESDSLPESAGQQYKAALRLDSHYIPALMALGNLSFSGGDFRAAEGCYRQILRQDKNHAGANNNLAMVYLARGKSLVKAERYAQTALKQGGALRPYVLETLAEIYIRQKRFQEALNSLNEADAAVVSENKVLSEQISRTRKTLVMNQQ